MRSPWIVSILATLLLGGVVSAMAQQQRAAPKSAATQESPEPELKFEREYYVYPTGPRRDPFSPLSASSELGPSFEELNLNGIVFSPNGQSVALLSDASGRIYRARRGDRIGNARVVNIPTPMKVVFAVESFGLVRQEELELKRKNIEGEQL